MEFLRVLAMFSWPMSDSKVSGLYFLADTINCSITRIVSKDRKNCRNYGIKVVYLSDEILKYNESTYHRR